MNCFSPSPQITRASRSNPEGIPGDDSRASDLVYWLHLGERHAPNFSMPLSGYIWSFLPTRRDTFEKLHDDAIKDKFGADSTLWATFLGQEVRGLRRSEALANSLVMALEGPRACRDSATAVTAALAPPGPERPHRRLRLACTAWRAWRVRRHPSTCAELWAHTQQAVWRWAKASTPQWGELHLPMVFNAPTAAEFASLRAGKSPAPMSHVGYLGISAHDREGTPVLHLRIDDSWHLPCLTAAARPGEHGSSRPRLYAATVIVPKRALRCAAIAERLRPLLSCVQDSSDGFRDAFFALATDPELGRLGGGRHDIAGLRRPLAAQAGPCWLVKNHSRGVAARLDAFLSDRGRDADAASDPEASRQLWRWLKAQERAAVHDLVACQIGDPD